MRDRHYYGCCACIGAAGLGLVPKMQLLTMDDGFAVGLYINGSVRSKTPTEQEIVFRFHTEYPKYGKTEIQIGLEAPERFKIKLRNPSWSKKTLLAVNGKPLNVRSDCMVYPEESGKLVCEITWADGSTDMLVK
jgi:DUF1680 family protein